MTDAQKRSQRRYRAKASTKAKEAANRLKWRAENRERDNANRQRWKNENKAKVALSARKVALKRKYGLTLEMFNRLLESQGWACAICSDAGASLVVDHCHTTGKVRGIICIHCNRIVHARATPASLRLAAAYLEASNG